MREVKFFCSSSDSNTCRRADILLNNNRCCEIQHSYISEEEIVKLTVDDLLKIDGIGNVNAKQFVENIKKFYEFLDKIGYKCDKQEIKKEVVNIKTVLKDKKFIFTGFRNKDWEKLIIDSGGKVVTSVSKTVDYLVVKNKTDKSSKIDKANELDIKILDMEEFSKMIG